MGRSVDQPFSLSKILAYPASAVLAATQYLLVWSPYIASSMNFSLGACSCIFIMVLAPSLGTYETLFCIDSIQFGARGSSNVYTRGSCSFLFAAIKGST